MLHDILNILKEYRIFPALLTGLFSFFAVWFGVTWATRSNLIIKKIKIETKERIRIESSKKIVQVLKDFPLAISSAGEKISSVISYIISELKVPLNEERFSDIDENGEWKLPVDMNTIEEELIRELMEEQKDAFERGGNNLKNECKKVQELISLLESDLDFYGENKVVRDEIAKIKSMFSEIKNILKIEAHKKSRDEAEKYFSKMLKKYKHEIDEAKAKAISDKLIKIYAEWLN